MRALMFITTMLCLASCGVKAAASSGGSAGVPEFEPERTLPIVTNAAWFYRLASGGRHENWPVCLEGVVWWADPEAGRVILVDRSGAVPVRLTFSGEAPRPGQGLRLEGECSAQRSGLGFILVPALVVNNDGLHLAREASGSVVLRAGLHPIRLAWINRHGQTALKVSYEGPDLPRQVIPDSALFRLDKGAFTPASAWVPGLEYQCWEGEWGAVPDFTPWPVVARGQSANFDLGVRSRRENVGLEFTGFLEILREGRYHFYTESDDGSLLFVGQPEVRITALQEGRPPAPRRLVIGAALADEEEFGLYEAEGEVISVLQHQQGWRLELQSGRERLRLEVGGKGGCCPAVLLGGWLRATGIVHGLHTLEGRRVAGALWSPAWEKVELVRVSPERWAQFPLVRLRELAERNHPGEMPAVVRVRGNVGSLGSGRVLVLQDGEGEVHVGCGQPLNIQPGDAVEAVGRLASCEDRLVLENAVVQQQPAGPEPDGLPLLTRVRQVRSLSPEQAARNYPVRVRGVVTAKFIDALGLVIQDHEQGIYVGVRDQRTRGVLEIGDYCEVTGVSLPGYFAPIIDARELRRLGLSALPEPVWPTRDQVLNGSLDAQYVEIQGIVTGASEGRVELLTRVGGIELLEINPEGTSRKDWRQYENALVRVRGCVFAGYDRATGLLQSGSLRIIEPTVLVDEPAPADPFALPLRSVAALRGFDPQASALQRVRVAGQLIHTQPDLHCVLEGTNGLRFYPREPVPAPAGAMVEVVGVLDLGGFAPVLRQAVVRPGRRCPLPEPRQLQTTNLFSGSYDATRVRVESHLLKVGQRTGHQVMDLRTGNHLHTARLYTGLGLLPPLAPGSRVAVTGVYVGRGGDWAAGREVEDFEVVLGGAGDIVVLKRPPWWTPGRVLALAGVLGAVLLASLLWIHVLRYEVRQRTGQLAREIQTRQRIQQQQALERERSRLARDLHDDLGGGLTEISLLGELAAGGSVPPEKKSDCLRQLTDRARQLVDALDEIVWTANPRYDSVPSLAGYCGLYAQRFLGLAGLRCNLDVPDDLPDRALDSTSRHGLLLAFKEALNNVVCHAQATEVHLRMAVSGNELVLAVADNGCGFDPSAPPAKGNGLANLRSRLADLGGQCRILSAAGQGTTVEMRLPLAQQPYDPGSHC